MRGGEIRREREKERDRLRERERFPPQVFSRDQLR
jgi:hypothetical protein